MVINIVSTLQIYRQSQAILSSLITLLYLIYPQITQLEAMLLYNNHLFMIVYSQYDS